MLVDHVGIVDPDKPLDTVFQHILAGRTERSFVPRGLPVPTNAIPGTSEKITVLKARLEAGLILHHPDDLVSVPFIRTKRAR